jgi:DNA-binding MarR family transcriptional regulator
MQILSAATNAPAGRCPPERCARAVLDGLPPVMWFLRKTMRAHRAAGLSVPQFRTLVLLDRYPTASLSCVAEHLGASPPTASRMVGGLVKQGLIVRKECAEDRRQVALLLTERGRSVLNKSRAGTQEQIAKELAHLSDGGRESIERSMRLLGRIFEKERGDETVGKRKRKA